MSVTAAWRPNDKVLAWGSCGIFFVGFILFFVGYTGTSWYVVPVQNNAFPPDNAIQPMTFGLFYLCYREHCKYDLRQDYYIVNLLPPEMGITTAYQQFRTVCMAIVTVAAGIVILTLGAHFLFLSGFVFSHFVGYVVGGLEILAGVIAMIGVIVFGNKFRGASQANPFGWSLWLVVVSLIIFIINGILLLIHTISITRNVAKMQTSSRGRPLNPLNQPPPAWR
jgi:hypothetical protein